MNLELLGPRILVELEQEEDFFQQYRSLVKPESVHETAQGWGKVLQMGDGTRLKHGDKAPIRGVKVGDRVSFVKFLKEAATNKSIAALIGEDKLIIELKDIVVVEPS